MVEINLTSNDAILVTVPVVIPLTENRKPVMGSDLVEAAVGPLVAALNCSGVIPIVSAPDLIVAVRSGIRVDEITALLNASCPAIEVIPAGCAFTPPSIGDGDPDHDEFIQVASVADG